jgi:hypothetical protein
MGYREVYLTVFITVVTRPEKEVSFSKLPPGLPGAGEI